MEQEYFEKFEEINDKYLPDYGEGDTFASQAVTAVNKLIYKWFNDGDVYDNTYHLKGWANDLSSYANWLYNHIEKSKYYLNEIKGALTEKDYEEILVSLADLILNEDFLTKANEMPTVGSIYDCDGPFEYEEEWERDEYSDDEDDWYRSFGVEDLLPLTNDDEDAAEIILKWYDKERAYEDFDDKEDYISFIEDDISDMLDAATSSDEVEIVKKALNIDIDESLTESSKSNYTIEYYLNTATADRRPSTKEDVEEDYIYDTIQASNDLEALEEAFYIQTGEDYDGIFDDYRVEDTVEGLKNYFDSRDIGDGSIIICKITQGSRVIYDSTLNKQFFLDEVDEDEEEDDEDLMDESLNGEKLDSYTQKYVDNAVKQVLEWFQDIVEEGQLDKDNEDPYYTGLINLEELIYIYTSAEATYDLPYEGPYAAKDPYNYSTEEQERFDNLVIEQALPKVRELYNKYLKKRDLICLK